MQGQNERPRRMLQEVPPPPASAPPLSVGVWIGVAVGALVLLLLSAAAVYYYLKRKGSVSPLAGAESTRNAKGRAAQGGGAGEKSGLPRFARVSAPIRRTAVHFTYDEILEMTDNWNPSLMVEDAGYRSVHKGRTKEGQEVAVKRGRTVSMEGGLMFRNEVAYLTERQHPNVVAFVGSCDENKEQILVFEFLPNHSLQHWLRPPANEESLPPLNFPTRLSIAVDVATALVFIHAFKRPPNWHRDVKSSTVLLDAAFRAKLGGLGLLKHLPGTAMEKRKPKTQPYKDPESAQTLTVTAACDVYSFGVVLLELITALPPMLDAGEGGSGGGGKAGPQHPLTLPQWFIPRFQSDRLDEMVDPRLPLRGPVTELLTAFAQVAAACVTPFRRDRPDMGEVLALLKQIQEKLGDLLSSGEADPRRQARGAS